MKPKPGIFKTIEKYNSEKFPENIDLMLITSGFDCKAILNKIDANSLNTIEQFINTNRRKFEEILKNTKYETEIPFAFLPGHRALILGLPEILKSIDAEKQKSKSKKTVVQTQSETNQDNNYDEVVTSVNSNAEGNYNSDEESSRVKELLIQRIDKYCLQRKIPFHLTEEYMKKFRYENTKFKCELQCPFCARKAIPCHFESTWICGNFTSHLKLHENQSIEEYEVDPTDGTLRLTNAKKNQLSAILNR